MRLDTLYSAEVPEGIGLSLRPAGVGARFYAALIDSLIRYAVLSVVFLLGGLDAGLGGFIALLAVFFMEWFYPVLFELLSGGATPGKRVMSLRVVMDNGLPVTPAASVVRNFLRTVDFLPMAYAIGVVAMLLRSDFKRLGDMAAGTVVVYAERMSAQGELPDAPAIPPALALELNTQKAIVSWATRSRQLTPERSEELAGLAKSIIPPEHAGTPPVRALLGVAQWLVGKR